MKIYFVVCSADFIQLEGRGLGLLAGGCGGLLFSQSCSIFSQVGGTIRVSTMIMGWLIYISRLSYYMRGIC